jgi:hypothetical protein
MILAATVGDVDVDGMLDRITPQQFDEWMVFYSICPWAVGWPVEKPEEKQSSVSAMRQLAGV